LTEQGERTIAVVNQERPGMPAVIPIMGGVMPAAEAGPEFDVGAPRTSQELILGAPRTSCSAALAERMKQNMGAEDSGSR